MSKPCLSVGIAAILLALSAVPPAWAAFNDDRGKLWRGQCTAGQSKYTCCKNAELDCIDDCGELQSCQSGCSASYTACVRALVRGPQDINPDLTGGGMVLDPGSPTGGKLAPRAPAGGVLAPR